MNYLLAYPKTIVYILLVFYLLIALIAHVHLFISNGNLIISNPYTLSLKQVKNVAKLRGVSIEDVYEKNEYVDKILETGDIYEYELHEDLDAKTNHKAVWNFERMDGISVPTVYYLVKPTNKYIRKKQDVPNYFLKTFKSIRNVYFVLSSELNCTIERNSSIPIFIKFNEKHCYEYGSYLNEYANQISLTRNLEILFLKFGSKSDSTMQFFFLLLNSIILIYFLFKNIEFTDLISEDKRLLVGASVGANVIFGMLWPLIDNNLIYYFLFMFRYLLFYFLYSVPIFDSILLFFIPYAKYYVYFYTFVTGLSGCFVVFLISSCIVFYATKPERSIFITEENRKAEELRKNEQRKKDEEERQEEDKRKKDEEERQEEDKRKKDEEERQEEDRRKKRQEENRRRRQQEERKQEEEKQQNQQQQENIKIDDRESLLKEFGLDKNATREQIRKNYQKLALVYHPDKVAEDDPEKNLKEEMFKKYNNIYEKLKKYFDL